MTSITNIHLLQVDAGSGACCNGDFDVTPFIFVAGTGIALDQVTSYGTLPGCNNIGSYNQITISASAATNNFKRLQYELDAAAAIAINGAGLNLTTVTWDETYPLASAVLAADVPFQIFKNGVLQLMDEYTYTSGIIVADPAAVWVAGNVLTILILQ